MRRSFVVIPTLVKAGVFWGLFGGLLLMETTITGFARVRLSFGVFKGHLMGQVGTYMSRVFLVVEPSKIIFLI